MTAWHRMDIASVLEQLGTSPQGLTPKEAARRLEEHGRNELEERGLRSPLAVFAAQFTEIMVLVLIVAAPGLLPHLRGHRRHPPA